MQVFPSRFGMKPGPADDRSRLQSQKNLPQEDTDGILTGSGTEALVMLGQSPGLVTELKTKDEAGRLPETAYKRIERKVNEANGRLKFQPQERASALISALSDCQELLGQFGDSNDPAAESMLYRIKALVGSIVWNLEGATGIRINAEEMRADTAGAAGSATSADKVDMQKMDLAKVEKEAKKGLDAKEAQSYCSAVVNMIRYKMSMASLVGTINQDPVGQVHLLLSAYEDGESAISNIGSRFPNGVPSNVQNAMEFIEATQSRVIGMIRNVTGLNLSDREFRELLVGNPGETGKENILGRQMKDESRKLFSGMNDAACENPFVQNNAKLSGNACTQVSNEIETIIREASGLLQSAKGKTGSEEKVAEAVAMLNRGKAIAVIANAMDKGALGGNRFQGEPKSNHERLDQLLGQSVELLSMQQDPDAESLTEQQKLDI